MFLLKQHVYLRQVKIFVPFKFKGKGNVILNLETVNLKG